MIFLGGKKLNLNWRGKSKYTTNYARPGLLLQKYLKLQLKRLAFH